jgi:hypothetical protein
MTAMTKARTKSVRIISRERRPLAANAKVFANALAVCAVEGAARGFYQQADAGASFVAVGYFREDVDNTGGANGAKLAEIEYFRDRKVILVENDEDTAVLAADREQVCYLLDDQTATGDPTGASEGGVTYDVTSEGVWLEVLGLPKPKRVQRGTGTLAAGTKTVQGVALRANSTIQLTMRDPGAGAITGFAALDAPVATRSVANGQFVVNAIDDAKALINTAVCTFDWAILDD